MPINCTANPQLGELSFERINRHVARGLVAAHHYMHTWPSGSRLSFGVRYRGALAGCWVFGYASTTGKKVAALGCDLAPNQYIEMQRMWLDDALGHNAESYCLARVIKALHVAYSTLQLIFTHAGGCKDDAGFVYQASAWLYFGSEPCSDFYLTDTGEYRNTAAAQRFGRLTLGADPEQALLDYFGPGQIVHAHRHRYAYPIHKGLRRRLARTALPYPKESAQYRYDQQWVDDYGASGGRTLRGSGSNPDRSTTTTERPGVVG